MYVFLALLQGPHVLCYCKPHKVLTANTMPRALVYHQGSNAGLSVLGHKLTESHPSATDRIALKL